MSITKTTYINFVFTLFLLSFSKNAKSQCFLPEPYVGNTGVNMTLLLQESFITSLNVQSNDAYIVARSESGLVVGSVMVNDSQTSIAIWGDDTFTSEIDGASENDTITFSLIDNNSLFNVTPITTDGGSEILYTTNAFFVIIGSITESIDLNYGCTDNVACNYCSTATIDDGSCDYFDSPCDTCDDEGFVVNNDLDNDGVCDFDEIPGCQDTLACNYNPLATDPPIDFDIGVNPMECSYDDTDNDGICDLFEITGCTDYLACNYDATPTTDSDSLLCLYAIDCQSCSGEQDGTGSIIDNDTDSDGVCDDDEIVGCQDPFALNYDPNATDDNGSCAYPDIDGCMNPNACNFNPDATIPVACNTPEGCETCDDEGFVVNNDLDNDGVCDDDEILGCQDPLACNFYYEATDSASCIIPQFCETCSGEIDGTGVVIYHDTDNDGVCNDDEVLGCTDSLSCNYSFLATEEDNTCLSFDLCGECGGNNNCTVFIEDTIQITIDESLVQDSLAIEIFGNNFEDLMETQLGFPEGCIVVIDIIFPSRGNVEIEVIYTITLTEEEIQMTDLNPDLTPEELIDEINDELAVLEVVGTFEDIEFIEGCLNVDACNYNLEANIEAECFVPSGCEACSGETNDGSGFILSNDLDGDGICNLDEITGCTDDLACNYDGTPTTDTDNSSCIFSTGCESCSGEQDGTGTIVDNDFDNDGVCNQYEISGCKDASACNYDATSTTDTVNSLCNYSIDLDGCATCSGETDGTGTIIDNDTDDDGVCNDDEVSGCTDVLACNYDATSTTDEDNSLCNYSTDLDGCASCSGEQDGTGTIIDNDLDDDGVCNQDEIEGCITMSACNYNDLATDDDESCVYAEAQFNCDGECLFDYDNDGVCDPFEILGCTDVAYLEYNESATQENGSCETLVVTGCLDDLYLEYDILANTNNSSLCLTPIVLGCMNTIACNFNSEANTSDDSCEIIDGICDICEDGVIVDNDLDDDGVCDVDEVLGCQDDTACNFDVSATDADPCIYSTDLDACASCSGATDGSGTIVDNDADDDGVCNDDEIIGCTDALACNYDATSTTDTDNSLCDYLTDLDDCATCSGETDGTGTIIDNDYDDDGVCDEVDYDDGIGLKELVNVPINLYPNPSKDFINLDFKSNLSNVSIEILNTLGDVLLVQSSADISSKHTMQIAVHNLPSGLYMLRVKSDHQLYRLNWIKN